VGPAEFSNYVYGAAIILVILVAPGGIAAAVAGRTGRSLRRRPRPPRPQTADSVSAAQLPSGTLRPASTNKEARQV
jgi:branched-chain amino acid transport system permease protein